MTAGAVIIGAGQAGGRAALMLAEGGYNGPVTLIGAETLPPYERPPLSKDMLSDPATPPTWLADPTRYQQAGIRLVLGRQAIAIDRRAARIRLDDGTDLPYAHLVLATGSRPRRLPFTLDRLHDLRTIDDVTALSAHAARARSVLIVGGGVIGLEVAATLATKGLAVTVVEIGSRLLGRNFPAPVAALIAARHATAGVAIRTATRVRALHEDTGGIHATLSDGSILSADVAVAGIGVVPDSGLAQAAGLAVDDGIVVDHRMRSSDPAIFAIGDVAAQPGPMGRAMRCETWQNANVTAAHAVAAILGAAPPVAEAPWFWTDQYDLNVQLAGITGPEADGARIVEQQPGAQNQAAIDGRLFLVLDGNRLIGAAAVNAGREMSICRRLVTAGAMLPDALIGAATFDGRAARAVLNPRPASARLVDA